MGNVAVSTMLIEGMISTPAIVLDGMDFEIKEKNTEALKLLRVIKERIVLIGEADINGVYNQALIRCNKHNLIVDAHEGIYYILKNGEHKPIGTSTIKGYKMCTLCIDDIRANLYVHQLAFFALYPKALKIYLENPNLVVNHMVISTKGPINTSNPYDYELISRALNFAHASFIRAFNLYNVPISAADIPLILSSANQNLGIDIHNISEADRVAIHDLAIELAEEKYDYYQGIIYKEI